MESEDVTENSIGSIEGLIQQLGLRAHDRELFIGKVRGFPVGLKFIGSNEPLLLLFQIRYPVDAESKAISGMDYSEEVAGLIKARMLEISVEDRIAWLTLPDSGPLIERNSVARVLNTVLIGFEKAGLAGLQDKCHYCQEQPVESLTCRDGKVAQICSLCLDGKVQARAVDSRASVDGISKCLILGILGSLVGALAWSIVWVGYERLFDLLKADKIVVPRILEAIVLAAVGFLVGGPIGFILKRIPNRGDLLAGWMAVVFAVGSIVLGEILFSVWLVHNATGILSFSTAAKIVPRYLADAGVYYIAEKFMAGIICVGVAYEMSRPQKKGLKL